MNTLPDVPNVPEQPADQPEPARGVRIVHLVFGILFLGVAAIWALGVTDALQLDVSIGFALPLTLILAGVAGLIAMLVNGARGRRTNKTTKTQY